MKSQAFINGQDMHNFYKTPIEMEFTDSGYPKLAPLSKEDLHFDESGELSNLPFNYAISNRIKDVYIHFFIQDYLFERVWRDPQRYIEILKDYNGIVMPDFSLFTDIPLPLQRFNYYRNLWVARFAQICGVQVIPSICFSDESSYDFCFEGIPENSVVLLSAVGSIRDPWVKSLFIKGVREAIHRIKPSTVIIRSTEKSREVVASIVREAGCEDILFFNYSPYRSQDNGNKPTEEQLRERAVKALGENFNKAQLRSFENKLIDQFESEGPRISNAGDFASRIED